MDTQLILRTAAAVLVLLLLVVYAYITRNDEESSNVQALRAIHNTRAGDVMGEQGRAVSNITAIIFLVVVVGMIITLVIW